MKETALLAAFIAAIVSLSTAFLTSILAERREWRRARWERELERFFGLEESAGRLVETVLAHGARDHAAVNEQLAGLYNSVGRFLRYPRLAAAVRDLHHSLACYLAEERSFSSAVEYEAAREKVGSSLELLFAESDFAYQVARSNAVVRKFSKSRR